MKFPLLLLLMASTIGIVFAQAAAPVTSDSIDPWLQAGGLLASLSALIWVVQHVLRNTIPAQEKTFQVTLDKIIERSEKHDEQFRDLFITHTQRCEQIQQRWVDQSREKQG